MAKKDFVLLITTALSPPDGVFFLNMNNISQRIVASKSGFYSWAAMGVTKIVIADSTNQILLNTDELIHINKMGIEVEQLRYQQNDDLVREFGKGYAEGMLIDFAIKESILLGAVNNFFKCTGKIFCSNFSEIYKMIEDSNIQNLIWRDSLNSDSADSRFFYTTHKFCKDYIIPSYYDINDKIGQYSEHCLLKVAKTHLTQGYGLRPSIYGFSGSTNHQYFNQSLGYLDSKFPCWFG